MRSPVVTELLIDPPFLVQKAPDLPRVLYMQALLPAGDGHSWSLVLQDLVPDYRALLASHGIRASMSRKGNCWDNAVAESFFSSFAFELEFEANWYDVRDVERSAGDHIEGFYNPRRRHSPLRVCSPSTRAPLVPLPGPPLPDPPASPRARCVAVPRPRHVAQRAQRHRPAAPGVLADDDVQRDHGPPRRR